MESFYWYAGHGTYIVSVIWLFLTLEKLGKSQFDPSVLFFQNNIF